MEHDSSDPDFDFDEVWSKFVDFVHGEGDRVTPTRRTVFEAVMARHDHFSAESLVKELSRGTNRVSRGTVYRTLSLLHRAGFVNTIRNDETHLHYEHTFGHSRHDHMLCERCRTFFEFTDPDITDAIHENCRKNGFEPRRHRLIIFGLCNACRDKGFFSEGAGSLALPPDSFEEGDGD